MKALSLSLVKGSIDEVEQKCHMTWVQPRVLDLQQVSYLPLLQCQSLIFVRNKLCFHFTSIHTFNNLIFNRTDMLYSMLYIYICTKMYFSPNQISVLFILYNTIQVVVFMYLMMCI